MLFVLSMFHLLFRVLLFDFCSLNLTIFQISSDLISYEGDVNASKADKIAQVKRHVKAMHDMLQEAKEKELNEQNQVGVAKKSYFGSTIFRYLSSLLGKANGSR